MKRLMIAGAAALALTTTAIADAERPDPFQSGVVAGTLSRPLAAAAGRAPAVVILPDSFGPDWRADAYVLAFNAVGFLVLEVDLHAIAEAAGLDPSPLGRALAVAMVVGELARDPRVAPGRIGVLGFGAGGRAALLAPPMPDGRDPIAARAVLYPGCIGLDRDFGQQAVGVAAGTSPVLVMHGDADAANPTASCALAAGILASWVRAEHVTLAGAGYAWDRPGFAVEGPSLLPRPDGAGRIRATHDPRLQADSVVRVASWMARALGMGEGAPPPLTTRP